MKTNRLHKRLALLLCALLLLGATPAGAASDNNPIAKAGPSGHQIESILNFGQNITINLRDVGPAQKSHVSLTSRDTIIPTSLTLNMDGLHYYTFTLTSTKGEPDAPAPSEPATDPTTPTSAGPNDPASALSSSIGTSSVDITGNLSTGNLKSQLRDSEKPLVISTGKYPPIEGNVSTGPTPTDPTTATDPTLPTSPTTATDPTTPTNSSTGNLADRDENPDDLIVKTPDNGTSFVTSTKTGDVGVGPHHGFDDNPTDPTLPTAPTTSPVAALVDDMEAELSAIFGAYLADLEASAGPFSAGNFTIITGNMALMEQLNNTMIMTHDWGGATQQNIQYGDYLVTASPLYGHLDRIAASANSTLYLDNASADSLYLSGNARAYTTGDTIINKVTLGGKSSLQNLGTLTTEKLFVLDEAFVNALGALIATRLMPDPTATFQGDVIAEYMITSFLRQKLPGVTLTDEDIELALARLGPVIDDFAASVAATGTGTPCACIQPCSVCVSAPCGGAGCSCSP